MKRRRCIRPAGRAAVAAGATLTLMATLACSRDAGETPPVSGVYASDGAREPGPRDEKLLHLEGRFGSPGSLAGEATYKVKREAGVLIKEIEVEVEGATPGVRHTVTLDGVEIGRVITDLDGEAELDLVEDDEGSFPEDFPIPEVGSVVRVGELMELHLDMLERLAHLETEVSGAGGLTGRVKFTMERLSGAVTREFQVKLKNAESGTAHAVTVSGVQVGEIAIGSSRDGKLEYSETGDVPFPEGFPELRVGMIVTVGDLFRGELEDRLGASGS